MRLVHVAAGLGAALLLGGLTLVGVAWSAVERAAGGRIVDSAHAPDRGVAIVFGAAVGSTVLRDRVETAAQLYRDGKVRHLLLSGDNRRRSYDEPNAMRRMALDRGVPDGAIVLDYAGRRTYDSCARARDIFRVGDPVHGGRGAGGAILVTQEFHLARAIYLCRSLGLDNVVGVAADRQAYGGERAFWAREVFANVRAWLDVHVHRPRVVGGKAEPITDQGDDPDETADTDED